MVGKKRFADGQEELDGYDIFIFQRVSTQYYQNAVYVIRMYGGVGRGGVRPLPIPIV
jgi:hypothetical protein